MMAVLFSPLLSLSQTNTEQLETIFKDDCLPPLHQLSLPSCGSFNAFQIILNDQRTALHIKRTLWTQIQLFILKTLIQHSIKCGFEKNIVTALGRAGAQYVFIKARTQKKLVHTVILDLLVKQGTHSIRYMVLLYYAY